MVNPLAPTAGAGSRLILACGLIGAIWLVVAWALA